MKQIFILKEPINKISSPEDLFKKIKKIKVDFEQENFILICLNTANQIIKSEIVFKGALSECIISPQTIFKKALKCNAKSIIIGHNHPSKNLNPSQEDRQIYKILKEGAKLLNIQILDNIIFNKKEFYSFNSEGLKDE